MAGARRSCIVWRTRRAGVACAARRRRCQPAASDEGEAAQLAAGSTATRKRQRRHSARGSEQFAACCTGSTDSPDADVSYGPGCSVRAQREPQHSEHNERANHPACPNGPFVCRYFSGQYPEHAVAGEQYHCAQAECVRNLTGSNRHLYLAAIDGRGQASPCRREHTVYARHDRRGFKVELQRECRERCGQAAETSRG